MALLLPLVREAEGYRNYAYDDFDGKRVTNFSDAIRGTLTIGYGHTRGVLPGATCTEDQALKWLQDDLDIAAKHIELATEPAILNSLTDGQYAALIDFVYNTGAGRDTQVFRALNDGRFGLVPQKMNQWVYQTVTGKDGTKTKVQVAGLQNRRAAEILLWSEHGMPVLRDRAVEEPESKPLVKDANAWAHAGLTVVGAVVTAASVAPDAAVAIITGVQSALPAVIQAHDQFSEALGPNTGGIITGVLILGFAGVAGVKWWRAREEKRVSTEPAVT
jgi:lysozyme